MTCISRPMPESLSRSWTSSSRALCPLMAYSEPPLRNIVREIVTSAYSMGRAPSVLSIVRTTSARPRGGRPEVPAKMTSSILPPRNDLAPCSPMTHERASTTLDLPEPLGPTMHVIPGSSCSVVADAKDLKPFMVRLLRYKPGLLCLGSPERSVASCGRQGALAGPGRRFGGKSARLTLPAGHPRSGEVRACRGLAWRLGSYPGE